MRDDIQYTPRVFQPRKCDRCQQDYQPTSGTQVFCPECAVIVTRERNKAKWEKQKNSPEHQCYLEAKRKSCRERYWKDKLGDDNKVKVETRGGGGKSALVKYDPDGDFTGKRLPAQQVNYMRQYKCFTPGTILVISGKEIVVK